MKLGYSSLLALAMGAVACGGEDPVNTSKLSSHQVTVDVTEQANGNAQVKFTAESAANRQILLRFDGPTPTPSTVCQDAATLSGCVSLDDVGTTSFNDVCPGTWTLVSAEIWPTGSNCAEPAVPTAFCSGDFSFDITAGVSNQLDIICADPANTNLIVDVDCTNGC